MEKKTEMVQLPNGQNAPILVANLNEAIKMVIISEKMLKHLVKLLPEASISDIVAEHVNNVNNMHPATMEKFTDILRDELEFHESINLVKEFVLREPAPKQPARLLS